jgi:hypothetical protein
MGFLIGGIDFHDPASGYMVNGPITRKLEPKLIVRQNPFALVDNQIANVQNAISEWSIPIRIYGAGATKAIAVADMAAKIAALNAVLTADPNPNFVEDSLDYSGSPVTYYQMVKSNAILPGRQDLTEKRAVYEETIVVRTWPFGSLDAPVTLDLTPDAVTRVALFPLCGWSDPDDDGDPEAIPLEGDLPAPLTVTISGTALANAVCAVCPPDAELSDYDTGMSGGGESWGTPVVVAYGAIGIAGRFRVLASLQSGSSAGARVGIGLDDAEKPQTTVLVPYSASSYALYDLGEFSSSGDTELKVFVSPPSGASTAGCYLASLIIVPVDVSCVSAWNLPGVSSIVFSYNANTHLSYVIGNGITTPLDMANLLVVTDPAGSEYTVAISYEPLLYGWGQ